jgi:hypothetical protein
MATRGSAPAPIEIVSTTSGAARLSVCITGRCCAASANSGLVGGASSYGGVGLNHDIAGLVTALSSDADSD